MEEAPLLAEDRRCAIADARSEAGENAPRAASDCPAAAQGQNRSDVFVSYADLGQQEAHDEEQAALLRERSNASSSRPWYCDRQVILVLASYGVVAFLFNLLDEVRPIFASAPIEDGGLALPTDVLSWPLSFGGLSFILFVCLGYDRFYRATGGVWCTRWGMLLFIPAALLVPLATLFARNRPAVMAQLFLAMAVNSIADTSAYSGSNVLINAAAPPGVAGAVNGAGQAVSALMRALGPFLGGFAWSLSIGIGVPGHQFLVFVCIAACAFLYQFVYAFVDLPDIDS